MIIANSARNLSSHIQRVLVTGIIVKYIYVLYTAILLIIIKVVGMSHVTKPPQCDLGSLLINVQTQQCLTPTMKCHSSANIVVLILVLQMIHSTISDIGEGTEKRVPTNMIGAVYM